MVRCRSRRQRCLLLPSECCHCILDVVVFVGVREALTVVVPPEDDRIMEYLQSYSARTARHRQLDAFAAAVGGGGGAGAGAGAGAGSGSAV
jgi:hypothetical protein